MNNNYSNDSKVAPDIVYNERFKQAENRHKFESKCGRYIYHISIIDYLQDFNLDKKSEAFLKTTFKRQDGKQISAVHPEYYQERFVNFMKQQVFINQKENTVYSTKKIKYKVFSGDFEKFKDLYHQYYLCFHCGHTYNDKKDVRVTLVNNLKK